MGRLGDPSTAGAAVPFMTQPHAMVGIGSVPGRFMSWKVGATLEMLRGGETSRGEAYWEGGR